jgi:hypothetical protein
MGMDLFYFLSMDILAYVAWYRTGQVLGASYMQVLRKNNVPKLLQIGQLGNVVLAHGGIHSICTRCS